MDDFTLHGDDYFTRIEEWFEENSSGTAAPRNRKLVLNDILQSFDHPGFHTLSGNPKFEQLKKEVKEIK